MGLRIVNCLVELSDGSVYQVEPLRAGHEYCVDSCRGRECDVHPDTIGNDYVCSMMEDCEEWSNLMRSKYVRLIKIREADNEF